MERKLSIVMILHEIDGVAEVLEAFKHQTLPTSAYELVIVESAPDGHGEPVVERNVRALEAHFQGALVLKFQRVTTSTRAGLRNAAIALSQCPVVLLWGGDFAPIADAFLAHYDFHEKHPAKTAAAIGPALFPTHLKITPFMRWLEDSGELFGVSFTKNTHLIEQAQFFYGPNVSLKRELLSLAGPSDETLPYHAFDDDELGQRLRSHGMRIHYLADPIGWHIHQVGFWERSRAVYWLGKSLKMHDLSHPETTPNHWITRVSKSPLNHLREALRAGIQFLRQRDTNQRDAFYKNCMEAVLAIGYRSVLSHSTHEKITPPAPESVR